MAARAKKKRWFVSAEVTISVRTVVEASSEREAIAAAMDQPMQSFCHQCSNGEEDREWVTSGELDGDLAQLRAELEE